ncbi:hypothetical protein GCM10020219_056500 [Nonomuraea dietziae]
MPFDADTAASGLRVLPFYRAVPRLVKDPVTELAKMGTETGGRIVRLDIGPFRPYLVSHPDHVQQVLKTDWSNFVREGMFWRPLQRVIGRSILGEGEGWESSRRILQPLFTARYTASLGEDMADIIADCILELDAYALSGRPVDGGHQMTRIVNQAVIKVLFGGRISRDVAERLAPEFATCATSIAFRLLFPFAPYSIKVPGDRAFLAAAKKIDEIVYPLIEQARTEGTGSKEVVSALIGARIRQDGEVDLKQVRDDLVSIYGAASETTAMSLTWLWSVLHDHPDVYARLQAEVDEVVGEGPGPLGARPQARLPPHGPAGAVACLPVGVDHPSPDGGGHGDRWRPDQGGLAGAGQPLHHPPAGGVLGAATRLRPRALGAGA